MMHVSAAQVKKQIRHAPSHDQNQQCSRRDERGLLTLLGGVIMLIAGNAGIGVAIILLSALYFALAEIIRYLAVIARGSGSGENAVSDQ